MKRWIAMAALVVFVAAAGFAFAAQRGWRPGWSLGFRGHSSHLMSQRLLTLLDNDQFRSEVNLTDDQVSRLRQIVTNTEKSNIQTRAQMRVEGIDLRQLLQSEKPDQDAVMKRVQRISELRGQMMKNDVQALLEAKTVLSAEQQDKIRRYVGQRFRELRERGWGRSWRGQHRGRMMTRPGTPPHPQTRPGPPSQ